jgi:hypothetical protein
LGDKEICESIYIAPASLITAELLAENNLNVFYHAACVLRPRNLHAGAPSARPPRRVNWGGRHNLETRRLHFAVFAGGVGRPGELVGRLHGDKEENGSGRQTARSRRLFAGAVQQ